ncbi:PKD domain-containing protein [Actinotalea sp.]|uniref:PKD domain-containing protein n=1 Tax=Actinotalea sp. TaxID=1872145 RepID=UPI00356665C0
MCIDGVSGGTVTRTCADGTTALDPLFRRPLDASGAPSGPWEQVDNGGCPEDPPVAVVLSAAEFARLPLTPSAPRLQPADGNGLVNADLIVYTDPAQQTLTTTILGSLVTVRATPTSYTWDFGDGTEPLTTTDAGRPYPEHTVTHPYTAAGDYRLTLTTTWTGAYQVDGTGPWLPVLGTATTTSTPQPTRITEVHTVLVANP